MTKYNVEKVFHSNDYTMSSEVIDPNKKRKPDFLIERLTDQDKLVRHLYVELKEVGGDHFEKALSQATKHIRATIEERSDTEKECFVVVQRGLYIGSFEFHARQEELEEKKKNRDGRGLNDILGEKGGRGGLRGIGRKKKGIRRMIKPSVRIVNAKKFLLKNPKETKACAARIFNRSTRLVINDCLDGIEKSEGLMYLGLIKK